MKRFGVPTITLKLLVAGFLLASWPSLGKAACHVVTPSGSGNKSGADWNNAYANLPSLVRGDTYYLADGAGYNVGTIGAASGSIVTTVKKATASDHCTDTGWNSGTMGSGQAKFKSLPGDGTSFVTFDGNGTWSGVGCAPDAGVSGGCGFLVDDSGCTSNCHPIVLQNSDSGAQNITYRYIEIKGGSSSQPSEDFFYSCCGNSPNVSNILISHMYMHDTWRTFILTRGVKNVTLEYSYLVHGAGTSAWHGESWSENGSSNLTFRYNVTASQGGTGSLVTLSSGSGGTTNGWEIYGNTWFSYPSDNGNGNFGWTANGTVACINSGIVCNNYHIYQNTIANQSSTCCTNAVGFTNFADEATTNGWTCQNNLIYNIASSVNMLMDCGGGAEDYNTIINSGSRSLKGAHDIVTSTNDNKFANSSPVYPAMGDWRLTAESSNYTGGVSLSSSSPTGCTANVDCYNIDPLQVIRGVGGNWTRGAFQFSSGSATLPNPPQNLQAAVQ
jgi:hypothetical protein